MHELFQKDFTSNSELIQPVWRYLTFSKFMSMLELQALWFCKLETLIDKFEGSLPHKTKKQITRKHLEFEPLFPDPELKSQLYDMSDRNVQDGRQILVVNCWFMGDSESPKMWDEYVGSNEGVVIKSNIKRLGEAIHIQPQYSRIGKVKYIDFSEYDMGTYMGHQAEERALLKQKKYEWENEIRIITMNFVAPGCLNDDGTPQTEKQLSGPGMYNPNRAGIYVTANLNQLIEAIYTAPTASIWFHYLVEGVAKRYGLICPVLRSSLR